ncbi:MAG: hypothetical protein SVJ22_11375, partial [Halobacteriota archaeon]|nr:hypothetical protein [Halobacteriota archaeon]
MNNQNVQAPVYPQGEACASQEATRIQFQYKGIPLDEIIDYYKSELKDEKDIKWETMQDGNGVIIHDCHPASS